MFPSIGLVFENRCRAGVGVENLARQSEDISAHFRIPFGDWANEKDWDRHRALIENLCRQRKAV